MDPAAVVPHITRQTETRVWLGWWTREPRPPLALRLMRAGVRPPTGVLRIITLEDPWSSIGIEGNRENEVPCQFQVIDITDLVPNTSYQLVLFRTDTDRVVTTGFVDTLPERLPDRQPDPSFSTRPFTILLGSCYSAPDDPDLKVGDTYARLWNSARHRPHIKFLIGDQVYVDQPVGDLGLLRRLSSTELRKWFISKYRLTWTRLEHMLQRGANVTTSDDHEFWNDYPERPAPVWPALRQSVQYRNDWKAEAIAHFQAIQRGSPVEQIDIGEDLSIFVADTRINRDRDGIRFMSQRDFQAMIQWVRGLRTPGVLVLGQPLLERPEGWLSVDYGDFEFELARSDYNLPHFVQYDDLVRALSWWCYHDLLVLAGDVHFGRIARFSILRTPDIYPVVVHEVVSSAMTVLHSAKRRFEIGPNGEGFPNLFPPYRNRQPNEFGSPVTYERVVPPMENDDRGTENHFMTLEFTRHPGGRGVEANIRAWLVNREPSPGGGLPDSAWTYTCSLDADRPSSAFMMIAPPVVDFGDVRTDQLVQRVRSLTVSSVGAVPIEIQSVSLRGAQANAFSITAHPPRPFPFTLQPGEAFPVSTQFQSSSVGEHQARVHVTGADLAGAPTVAVESILFADVVASDIAVLPNAINFGLVPVGQQAVRNVLVTNYGSASGRFRVDPAASQTPFQWTGDAMDQWRSLPPGGDELISVRYTPPVADSHSARLAIVTDDETLSIPLSGEGLPEPEPEIRAVPRQINFGVVSVGTTATLQLTLANDGAGLLAINAARIEGPDSALFALSSQVPTIIQPGQGASVTVSFAPVAMVVGGHQATLIIESNANNAPQLGISLFGAGAASNLLVVPTQIAFNPSPLANVLPPGVGSRRGLDIYNVGVARLTIAGGSFRVLETGSGRVSPHFEILDAAGQPFGQADLRLEGGASLSLSIQFRPNAVGDHHAEIRIAPTDQAQSPVAITVTGEGVV